MPIGVYSEIGELEGVVVHTPGVEVENMTPENAERALYSDILNLGVVSREHQQFKKVLEHHTKVFEVKDLLRDILKNEKVKESLVKRICRNEEMATISDHMFAMAEDNLSSALIEGVPLIYDSLTKFLSKERFSVPPLHNFFFTRDAAVALYDTLLVGNMASAIRLRESLIMEAIFDFHPGFSTKTINARNRQQPDVVIEGGDLLIARNDILLCGIGPRTTSQGVDFIVDHLRNKKDHHHIIVQELPSKPESFIHLDMVFTFLDRGTCMIYEPVIMKMNKYQTVHIYLEGGKVRTIREMENLPAALKHLGMDLEPLPCGGAEDRWQQEREQWHSGANFFAAAPGKVIGYERNNKTLETLNNHGFEVLRARDVIEHKVNLADYQKYVVALEGSELPRGGGGARCMTMPVSRKPVNW